MKPEPMHAFDRSLPMALLRAREAVMKKFLPQLRAHGLSPQQWRVLRALFDSDGLEMGELAQRCHLLPPSLSRIVHRLEARGLLRRRVSSSDQRRSIVSLCRDGEALVRRMAPESEARYAHIAEAFGYGKLELLYELLDELVIKLDAADRPAERESA